MNAKEITAYLQSLGDADKAAHAQRFFKTGEGEYGYGDVFLGIRVPVIRQAVKKHSGASIAVATKLLHSKFHELRMFALLLLVQHFKKGDADTRQQIYETYLDNTRYINNWDLVDCSAHFIVGAHLEEGDRTVLDKLAGSEMLWERRISMIATYWFIRKNQFDDTLRIADLLIADQEDLIHKAVGWMLREVGNSDRDVEEAFLKSRYQTMPRTMLRYAIEKFSKEERQAYLSGKA